MADRGGVEVDVKLGVGPADRVRGLSTNRIVIDCPFVDDLTEDDKKAILLGYIRWAERPLISVKTETT